MLILVHFSGWSNDWNAAIGIQDTWFAITENGCQYKNIREWTFLYVCYHASAAFVSLTAAEFMCMCSQFNQQKEQTPNVQCHIGLCRCKVRAQFMMAENIVSVAMRFWRNDWWRYQHLSSQCLFQLTESLNCSAIHLTTLIADDSWSVLADSFSWAVTNRQWQQNFV